MAPDADIVVLANWSRTPPVVAGQDLALTWIAYRRALAAIIGHRFDLIS